MDKLRFDFAVRATADGKSNVKCLTSISTPDGRTFGMLDEFQPAHLHTAMASTPHYTRMKNTLKKRHQIRRIWITMTKELTESYLDDQNNILFNDYFLGEITGEIQPATENTSLTEESSAGILGKLVQLDNKMMITKIWEKLQKGLLLKNSLTKILMLINESMNLKKNVITSN